LRRKGSNSSEIENFDLSVGGETMLCRSRAKAWWKDVEGKSVGNGRQKGLLEVGAARDQIYLPFDDGIKQIDRK